MWETDFCVEQLLSDLDGADGHTSLFIMSDLQEEMMQGLFKWTEETEQVRGLIHPKGEVDVASGSPTPFCPVHKCVAAL